MAGIVDLEDTTTDPDTGQEIPHFERIKAPSKIAKKVGERQDGSPIYQAGPEAKGYEQYQIVPNDYAEKARAIRHNTNLVKQFMRKGDMNEERARRVAREFKQEMDEKDTESERKDVAQKYFDS